MTVMTIRDAINQTLHSEMERDPNVVVLGEDIVGGNGTAGGPEAIGGIWGTTGGLYDKFGPNRVIDTPISESAIVGAAAGLALAGKRPVAELMFADFVGVSLDQLWNQMAKFRYMFGGKTTCPAVIRLIYGAGMNAAAQHSQSVYAMMTAMPGLKVVMPTTPADAKGLLKAAIRDPNPVVFLEHEMLYGTEFDVPQIDDFVVPIGQAKIRRLGTHVTITAHSRMVGLALKAAEVLAAEGIEAEVIDLRTLRPLDHATILASVRKTNRLVTAEEGWGAMGVGAEIIARVVEHAFDHLDAPPMRVCQEDVPLPYAANLEALSLPTADKIVQAVRAVCYVSQ